MNTKDASNPVLSAFWCLSHIVALVQRPILIENCVGQPFKRIQPILKVLMYLLLNLFKTLQIKLKNISFLAEKIIVWVRT